jgi:hypothetical protein
MKIIAIDTESTIGMLCPVSNKTIMWEFDDADEFEASILVSVLQGFIAADFPDDVTFCKEPFKSEWLKTCKYNVCSEEYNVENEADDNYEELFTCDILEKFDDNYIALDVTTYGMACGPSSFTSYFILDKKYESLIANLLIKDEES